MKKKIKEYFDSGGQTEEENIVYLDLLSGKE